VKHLVHAVVWARRHAAGQLPAAELAPLLDRLGPADTFYDVGVHAGSWSIPASRRLTEGHVFAFEALPYYAKVLRATLRLFGRRNVTITVGAVGDAEGEADILWKDASGRRLTGMTRMSRGAEAGETVRVPALTIDGFRRRHPGGRLRLIKIDVEGAELLVLRGARTTIDAARPFIFAELYDAYCRRFGYTARDVFDFFEGKNYRTMTFDAGAFWPLDPTQYGGAGDVLFVPAEEPFG
jgi:FkbM family methyltransferase